MNFSDLDWLTMTATLLFIIGYGIYKSTATRNLEGYFLGNRQLKWSVVLFSIMGTQASAITFLTAPGQAYTDGMRFIQYYLGIPFAMIVIAFLFLPLYHKYKLYTAYEFLERRFDLKTRTLTSFLFLLSRGLSTGISIFAPSIVLHSMLGWDIYWTNIFMGGLLIIYTVGGGARAVAYTQQLQFLIIYGAMIIAAYYAIISLPDNFSLREGLRISGISGKTAIVTSGLNEQGFFDWKDRYNIWSGLIGGFFLALSYFGTDQSQVGRYLSSKNLSESRKSLLTNGALKIPLQFFILFIGILIYISYTQEKSPVLFNQKLESEVLKSALSDQYIKLKSEFNSLQQTRTDYIRQISANRSDKINLNDEKKIVFCEQKIKEIRNQAKEIVLKVSPNADVNDTNYIFLYFVGDKLPAGIIGLIVAIIFLSAWGSIAAALNSLASSTMIDFHKRYSRKVLSESSAYNWSRFYTFIWGIFCVFVAQFAFELGNSLIEAVNILGSWFYGTILGIFLVAFLLKNVKGTAVFYSAILTELLVFYIYTMDKISFLWLNVIGTFGVIIFSLIFQIFLQKNRQESLA